MLKSCFTDHLIEAGCDEVGRGCLAGPVVAAAVILPKDFTHAALTDSKKLLRLQREEIAEEIKEIALAYAIAEVDNQKIDEINILNASYLAMHKAIEQLEIIPELLLIDGNCFKPHTCVPHECIVKGDAKFFSIAAASVLAKTYRDDLMRHLADEYPQYGWSSNVGYPTPAHKRAIQENGFTPWHRLTFKCSI